MRKGMFHFGDGSGRVCGDCAHHGGVHGGWRRGPGACALWVRHTPKSKRGQPKSYQLNSGNPACKHWVERL